MTRTTIAGKISIFIWSVRQMRSKLVAGNWKSNGNLAANQALLDSLSAKSAQWHGVEAAICAPYPYLPQLQKSLTGSSIAWGAQDVSEYGAGAYTGAVNAEMVLDFGCRYVIVGHSERRTLFGESDEVVATKFAAVLKAGLTPILCVGESLAERESNSTSAVVERQMRAVIAKNGISAMASAVVAYEPIWAIGTGKTASSQQAQDVHAGLRAMLASQDAGVAAGIRILYGGSVKANNAAELFAMQDIDGGLIGGASLSADEFAAICIAAKNPHNGRLKD